LKPTPKAKAATVSTELAAGAKIADISIDLGAANFSLNNWEVVSVDYPQTKEKNQPFDFNIKGLVNVTSGINALSLSVKDISMAEGSIQENGGKDWKVILNIGSAALPGKTFAFTLTETKKKPGMTLTTKGKIDVASPGSAITATVKPSNTASDIASVQLLTGPAGALKPSGDFRAAVTGANTFKITAAHGAVVPGVAQDIAARVTLRNGYTLPDKVIKVTPSQTVGKAALSRNQVTLYKLTPFAGDSVGVSLKTPANVRLGAVRLNDTSLKGLKLNYGGYAVGDNVTDTTRTDGFKIEQSGAGNWTLYFKDGIAPKATDSKGNVANLKATHTVTVKLELWAEGTYEKDSRGNFAGPLKDASGTEKTKPTMVNLKIIIK